jgi:hypothetical protein
LTSRQIVSLRAESLGRCRKGGCASKRNGDITALGASSAQAGIGQHSNGEIAICDILPQPQEGHSGTFQKDVGLSLIRMPGRRCVLLALKADCEPHHRRGHERHIENSVSAPFDLPENRRMTASDQAAASAIKSYPVIPDESCEKSVAPGGGDQRKRQAAFPRTRWPKNQYARLAY